MGVVSFPTSIKPKSNCIRRTGEAGTAIAIGEVLALNGSGKLILAQADVVAESDVVGVALTTATAAGQPVIYGIGGDVEAASGLKQGAVYVLSNTPGDVCDAYGTDLTEDVSRVSTVALGLNATSFRLNICNSGVVMNFTP